MIKGKVNLVLDCYWGSSGKGMVSTLLADRFGVARVSSANFPNAGHTARLGDLKFVAKALPTALVLNAWPGSRGNIQGYVTPGSGFEWRQLFAEWRACGMPRVLIHERASIVTEAHRSRESSGPESTRHIASTMQGTAAALTDKLKRLPGVPLAGGTFPEQDEMALLDASADEFASFARSVHVLSGERFRNDVYSFLHHRADDYWLHEGSQGYALSVDHGTHYPHCTSRNCTTAAALDHLGVSPRELGDVYLNVRSYPIRVGNVPATDRESSGFSGDFPYDCEELTWDEVAVRAGMPEHEAAQLAERERTTVTKRIRRVATMSFAVLRDAVRTNGATKLVLTFAQYLDWRAAGMRGDTFAGLPERVRRRIDEIEDACGVPVVMVTTGADHDDACVRGALL